MYDYYKVEQAARELNGFFLNAAFQCGDLMGDENIDNYFGFEDCPADDTDCGDDNIANDNDNISIIDKLNNFAQSIKKDEDKIPITIDKSSDEYKEYLNIHCGNDSVADYWFTKQKQREQCVKKYGS